MEESNLPKHNKFIGGGGGGGGGRREYSKTSAKIEGHEQG